MNDRIMSEVLAREIDSMSTDARTNLAAVLRTAPSKAASRLFSALAVELDLANLRQRVLIDALQQEMRKQREQDIERDFGC